MSTSSQPLLNTDSIKIVILSMLSLVAAVSISILLSPTKTQAQGLTDGFFRGKGNADATFSATFEGGDEFWAGDQKMDVPPFYGKITRTALSLYIAYGLTDNIDIDLNLPYISAQGDGTSPPPQDLSNIQDGALTIKWRPWRMQAGPGVFNFVIAGDVAVPLSDYENGAMADAASMKPILVAIGDRAPRFSGGLLLQYKFYSGVFTSVQAAYSLKGKADDLDVPDATLISGKLGYAGRIFYGTAWIDGQYSTDGTDIMQGPFPTNQVSYTRFGLTASVAILDDISLDASAFTTLDGKNVTDANAISVGITYKIGR